MSNKSKGIVLIREPKITERNLSLRSDASVFDAQMRKLEYAMEFSRQNHLVPVVVGSLTAGIYQASNLVRLIRTIKDRNLHWLPLLESQGNTNTTEAVLVSASLLQPLHCINTVSTMKCNGFDVHIGMNPEAFKKLATQEGEDAIRVLVERCETHHLDPVDADYHFSLSHIDGDENATSTVLPIFFRTQLSESGVVPQIMAVGKQRSVAVDLPHNPEMLRSQQADEQVNPVSNEALQILSSELRKDVDAAKRSKNLPDDGAVLAAIQQVSKEMELTDYERQVITQHYVSASPTEEAELSDLLNALGI